MLAMRLESTLNMRCLKSHANISLMPTLGRKNYLFAGSHEGAQRAAMFYSFFGTCKRNNINPFEWLRDVLERIPTHKTKKLDELLPQNWQKS